MIAEPTGSAISKFNIAHVLLALGAKLLAGDIVPSSAKFGAILKLGQELLGSGTSLNLTIT